MSHLRGNRFLACIGHWKPWTILVLALILIYAFSHVSLGQAPDPKDIIFLVDVSPSVCSEDQVGRVPGCTLIGADPQGFRSKLVKEAGARILKLCPECRVGLITFGGEAKVQISLTDSWPSAGLSLGVIPYTDFRLPLQSAVREFEQHRTWESGRDAIIVLISDGDPVVDRPSSDKEALTQAAEVLQERWKAGRKVTLYVLALEEKPERWALWQAAFDPILPASHIIYVRDVDSALKSLISLLKFPPISVATPTPPIIPVQTPTPQPEEVQFSLLGPRKAFAVFWVAQVCTVPVLREGHLISGTLALSPSGKDVQVRVPLTPIRDNPSCLTTTPLPDDVEAGTYYISASEILLTLHGKTRRVRDVNFDGSLTLLRPVRLYVQPPAEVVLGESVEFQIEIRNARQIPSDDVSVVLNGTEVPIRRKAVFEGQPAPGDRTIIMELPAETNRKPGKVKLSVCLKTTHTVDGVFIPPTWRCSTSSLQVISPATVWQRLLLRLLGILVFAALVLLVTKAYKPEILWIEAKLFKEPQRSIQALTSYISEQEVRFRRLGATILRDLVELQQGQREHLYRRLLNLGHSSTTKRQILALGMSQRWKERPQEFIVEAGLLARELPMDFFLFVALSPFVNAVGENGEEDRFERALSQSLSWIPVTGRRSDLEFVRLVRRYGVVYLREGIPLSSERRITLGPLAQIARQKPHPATVLAAVYYEMGVGLQADVPPQDRPRVEELLQDGQSVINHVLETYPMDEQGRQYWVSASRFFRLLETIWLNGSVPKTNSQDFQPFAPFAEEMLITLELASKYKGRARVPVEIKREILHKLEGIDPPFRSLVSHMISAWGVL